MFATVGVGVVPQVPAEVLQVPPGHLVLSPKHSPPGLVPPTQTLQSTLLLQPCVATRLEHLKVVVPVLSGEANMVVKVTFSSGSMNSLIGSRMSGRSMNWLRFRSRTPRQPAGQSVE